MSKSLALSLSSVRRHDYRVEREQKKVRHAVCRGILRRKKLSKRLFDVVSEEKPCGDFCAVWKSLQDRINIPAHDNIQ